MDSTLYVVHKAKLQKGKKKKGVATPSTHTHEIVVACNPITEIASPSEDWL